MAKPFEALPSASANIARGQAAMRQVLREKSTVHRAMHRDGLGWVDFVWGDEGKWPPNAKGQRKGGKGIAHALEARQRKYGLTYEEASALLLKMVRIIAEGKEIKRDIFPPSTKVLIGSGGVLVHLIKLSGGNAWTLTVYEDADSKDALDAVLGAFQPTRISPTPCRSEAGALPLVAVAFDPSRDRATHPGSYRERLPVGAADAFTLDTTSAPVKRAKGKNIMRETKTIRYNLKERGRKHVGQERNFNIRAICDAINSPSCQERVATRGMAGYYGHLPRIRFGMSPVDGVLDGGKYNWANA